LWLGGPRPVFASKWAQGVPSRMQPEMWLMDDVSCVCSDVKQPWLKKTDLDVLEWWVGLADFRYILFVKVCYI
jgi:hypothetical protein